MTRGQRRRSVAVAGALGITLVLTACSGDEGGDAAGTASPAAGCEAYADYGTFDDATVNIYSSIRDIEQERFEESFAKFEECTGIDIRWEGSGEFEAQLQVRIQGGNAPDIATIPQPGLLQNLVQGGSVRPASERVRAQSQANYPQDWLEYGTVDGTFYAPPLGANAKSFVWYSPQTFSEKGWTVPTTWAELKSLTEVISTTGIKPWCAGIESGDATGWPATDWLEDVMLRTASPEAYDRWVTHEIPFNDRQVVQALDEVGSILKNDKYVNGGLGGVRSIATTAWQDAGLPILEGECALHRAASFYANNWPDDVEIAENGRIYAFYLPGVTPDNKPLLGGGEFLAAFNDKPETQAVQLLFGSEQWVNEKARLGDWLTSNNKLDVANVANPIDKLSVQLLQDPETVFRFDGSDMMPGAVGAGSFWREMTSWITGKSTQDALGAIERSWP